MFAGGFLQVMDHPIRQRGSQPRFPRLMPPSTPAAATRRYTPVSFG